MPRHFMKPKFSVGSRIAKGSWYIHVGTIVEIVIDAGKALYKINWREGDCTWEYEHELRQVESVHEKQT